MHDLNELDKLLKLSVEDIKHYPLSDGQINLNQILSQAYRLILPRLTQAGLILTVKVADDIANQIDGNHQALLALLLHCLNTMATQLSQSKVTISVNLNQIELHIAIYCAKDQVRFDDLLRSDLIAQLCHRFGFQLSKLPASDKSGLSIKMPNQTPISDTPKTIKFLVVEDNEINATLLKHFLSHYSDNIHHVVNGKLAVEYTALNPVDIIMMDINMPVMDGIEACKQIRNQQTQPQPLIIAVTANSTDSNKQACLDAGMDNFLAKPFSATQIDDLLSPIVKSL